MIICEMIVEDQVKIKNDGSQSGCHFFIGALGYWQVTLSGHNWMI